MQDLTKVNLKKQGNLNMSFREIEDPKIRRTFEDVKIQYNRLLLKYKSNQPEANKLGVTVQTISNYRKLDAIGHNPKIAEILLSRVGPEMLLWLFSKMQKINGKTNGKISDEVEEVITVFAEIIKEYNNKNCLVNYTSLTRLHELVNKIQIEWEKKVGV